MDCVVTQVVHDSGSRTAQFKKMNEQKTSCTNPIVVYQLKNPQYTMVELTNQKENSNMIEY
jgi:hypothetical protein